MKPKLLVIAAANNYHFINPILDGLKDEFDLGLTRDPINFYSINDLWRAIEKTDIIWLEWLDGISLHILNVLKLQGATLPKKKYIVRCHRYELFGERRLLQIQAVEPSTISKLVFVSEHVRQIGIQHFPWMADSVVIPNLIDIDKFPFVDREEGKNLLFLGRISYVKNLPQMLTYFQDLVGMDSDYHLHVVGQISDPELFYYKENFIAKAGLENHVTFHGRQEGEDLKRIMADMTHIACESVFESQGVGILESMATGLKPVIFSFLGAENLFPEKYLHIDRKGFLKAMLEEDYNPAEYREFVEDNYSIQNKIGLYRDLINSTLAKEGS